MRKPSRSLPSATERIVLRNYASVRSALGLTGSERPGVRQRPGQEEARDLLCEKRPEGGLERVPGLEGPLGLGIEHALDPVQDRRR
jgi:hypothetical protein